MKFILFVLASFICSTSFSQVDTLFYDKDYKGVLLKDSCDYWRVADYENKIFLMICIKIRLKFRKNKNRKNNQKSGLL